MCFCFCLCSGMVGYGQWTDLEMELRNKVLEGQLPQTEANQIMQYIVTRGLPVVPEEVIAIPGLAMETREWLQFLPAWTALCTGLSYQKLTNKGGLRFDSRFALASRVEPLASVLIPGSLRLKNPGKWAMRWDTPGGESEASSISGSLLGQFWKRRIKFIVGDYRVGWGNRLIMSESKAFATVDDPVYALPVYYAFAPAWGTSLDEQKGVGLSWNMKRAKATLSLRSSQEMGAKVNTAGCLSFPTKQSEWGVVFVQSESECLKSFFASDTWAKKNIDWSFEVTANARRPEVDVLWQRIHNRNWEGFGQCRFSMLEKGELLMGLGGQWTSDHKKMQTRWSLSSESFQDHTSRLNIQWKASPAHRMVLFWKWNQRASGQIHEFNEHRLSLRFYAEEHLWKTQWRLECSSTSGSRGLGLAWGGQLQATPNTGIRWSIAHWSMPEGLRGYFTEPSMDGVLFRTMAGEGYRLILGMKKSYSSKILIEAFVTRTSSHVSFPINENLSTLGYAQTQLSARFLLQL